jgi:hypothetical protein
MPTSPRAIFEPEGLGDPSRFEPLVGALLANIPSKTFYEKQKARPSTKWPTGWTKILEPKKTPASGLRQVALVGHRTSSEKAGSHCHEQAQAVARTSPIAMVAGMVANKMPFLSYIHVVAVLNKRILQAAGGRPARQHPVQRICALAK